MPLLFKESLRVVGFPLLFLLLEFLSDVKIFRITYTTDSSHKNDLESFNN